MGRQLRRDRDRFTPKHRMAFGAPLWDIFYPGGAPTAPLHITSTYPIPRPAPRFPHPFLGSPALDLLTTRGICIWDAPTHVDLQHGGAHGGIFREADVVEGLAEDGPVVVLVEEVDLHARKADVVGDALVCKELGGEARGELELLQNYPFLKKKLMQKITPSLLAVANLNGLHPITLSLAPPSRPYRKLVAGNGLEVQRHGHADADVRLPLDGGGRDDEVVGVVAHQVDLKNAVGALKGRRGRPVTRGALLGASLKDSLLFCFFFDA